MSSQNQWLSSLRRSNVQLFVNDNRCCCTTGSLFRVRHQQRQFHSMLPIVPAHLGKTPKRKYVKRNNFYYHCDENTHCLTRLMVVSAVTRRHYSTSSPSRMSMNTAAETNSSSSTNINTNAAQILRNMMKPFLLKCHPDVHSRAMKDVQQLNLLAIQNLNSYIDIVHSIYKGQYKSTATTTSNEINTNTTADPMIEIDFVIHIDPPAFTTKKKKSIMDQHTSNHSRRKVQLVLPPNQICIQLSNYYYSNRGDDAENNNTNSKNYNLRAISQLQTKLYHHTYHEMNKLLRIAGLATTTNNMPSPLPDHDIYDVIVDDIVTSDEYTYQDPSSDRHSYQSRYSASNDTNVFRRAHHYQQQQQTTSTTYRKKTPREISRDQYTANIPWHNYEMVYNQAVADIEADDSTRGLISNHIGRKRTMIANLLSNIRCYQPSIPEDSDTHNNNDTSTQSTNASTTTISFAEQLIAFRRLSLLFTDYFDKLQMEEFGRMWENCCIVLTPKRLHNTSKSALYNRQRKLLKTAPSSSSKTTTTHSPNNNILTNGYSFTLHSNLSVTITIPIDFYDDELIDQLDTNVWDFYNYIDTDTQDDFFNPRPSSYY